MTSNSVIISNSSFVGSSAAGGTLTEWQGGRTALAIGGTSYASGAILFQMLMPNGTTFLNVGGPYGADTLTSFDLPHGRFKIVSGSGLSVGIFAVLASVPY